MKYGPAVAASAEHLASNQRARVRDSSGEKLVCTLMTHPKSVVGAMSSNFQSKLYLCGHQSEGAIPSVVDQICDGMSPGHLPGLIPDRRQYPTA